ncbi:MAG TPA: nucleoside triphosphate pyrophosphohydrolase [Bacteroidetes bacterium]|nr:nucleoside triphosphate pyrophosphohydrolase [Bacteroidota bacterium]
MKATDNFDDLVKIMSILRKECPWDRKQTHESIKDLMIEEIYEAIEAIDNKNFDELKKELGDLLLHIVFHAEMAREKSTFTINDVIFEIQNKLIRRHPHVFGEKKDLTAEKVISNWEKIKMSEKDRKSVLSGVPDGLPALIQAQRMQEKAGGVGFDWNHWEPAWEKLLEEIEEFKQALETHSPDKKADEFGDVLFSMVNVGRLLKLNAEDSLRLTNRKFKNRFNYIEAELNKLGKNPSDVSLEEMDKLWDEAKKNER